MKNISINSTKMKENNSKIILNAIRFSNSSTRIEVAHATGLTSATVTNIVGDLINQHFVKEIGAIHSTFEPANKNRIRKNGRKPIGLAINENAGYVIGIELLAGKITTIVTDFAGKIADQVSEEFSLEETGDKILILLYKQVDQMLQSAQTLPGKLLAIGIGTVGPIDHERGVIVNPPNVPGLTNMPIKDLLESRYHVPVVHEHQTAIVAFCEKWFGDASDSDCMLTCCVNVGIGSSLLINGDFFWGFHGSGAEIGHMRIDPNGKKCGCGNYGCLETVADTRALVNSVRECFKQDLELSKALGVDNADDIDLDFVVAHEDVEEIRCQVLMTARYVAYALCNCIMILSPDTIVMAGDLPNRSKIFVEEIRRIVYGTPYPQHINEIKIYCSQYKEMAGPLGAAALALDIVI